MDLAAGVPRQENIPTLAVASDEGEVTLLRTDTGTVRWVHHEPHNVTALVHGAAAVFVTMGEQPRYVMKHHPELAEGDPRHGYRPVSEYEPVEVVAYRAFDGAPIWRKSDWNIAGQAYLAVDSGMVFVGSGHAAGDTSLFALDAATGAVRWTRDYGERQLDPKVGRGPFQRFVAVRGGRVFLIVHELLIGGPNIQRLHTLDAITGAELWTHELDVRDMAISGDGKTVVIEQRATPRGQGVLMLRNAEDGAPAGELALPQASVLCGLSNAGVVYVSTGVGTDRFLSAVPAATGIALWHAPHIETQGIVPVGDVLLYAQPLRRNASGQNEAMELIALDARTGRCRWRWRTPENLLDLLFLWGNRMPEVARAIGDKVLDNVETLLDQAIEANDATVAWSALQTELTTGQWRNPHAVHRVRLETDDQMIYVGTRLGVFAIGASKGYPRWHALPMTDAALLALSPQL
jgi:outer membrane protein assembly factor BamB